MPDGVGETCGAAGLAEGFEAVYVADDGVEQRVPLGRLPEVVSELGRPVRSFPSYRGSAELPWLVLVGHGGPVLAGLETVEVAVLPLTAELPKAITHGFDIFDDRLVLVETVNAELAIREAEDVALYVKLFELYWAAGLQGEHASALITRIARELPVTPR